MILMEVRYTMKRFGADEFLEQVAPYAAMSRQEEGNYMYDYFIDTTDDDTVLLLEKWENDEILAAHFAADHFKKISEIKDKYVAETKINKYYIEEK